MLPLCHKIAMKEHGGDGLRLSLVVLQAHHEGRDAILWRMKRPRLFSYLPRSFLRYLLLPFFGSHAIFCWQKGYVVLDNTTLCVRYLP